MEDPWIHGSGIQNPKSGIPIPERGSERWYWASGTGRVAAFRAGRGLRSGGNPLFIKKGAWLLGMGVA